MMWTGSAWVPYDPILRLQQLLAEFRDSLRKGLSDVHDHEYGYGSVRSAVPQRRRVRRPLRVPFRRRLFGVWLELGAGHGFPQRAARPLLDALRRESVARRSAP